MQPDIQTIATDAITDLSGTVLAIGAAMIGVAMIYVAYRWVRRTAGG